MTLAFLLDTNVVSAPIAKQPDVAIVRALEMEAQRCAISAQTWHELLYGVGRLPTGRRKRDLTTYVEDVIGATFIVLPYDETAAAWHARERVRMEKRGAAAPYVDGQIAAIAQTNDLVLVTLNPRDFRGFEGLAVQDWSKDRRRR